MQTSGTTNIGEAYVPPTAPTFDKENVPPVTSSVESLLFSERVFNLSSSLAMSRIDRFWKKFGKYLMW